jgi:acetyl-CoA carboxylase carboxyltransferase component
VARAINAASKNRPVVVLANLSGFDGSPESMRKLQLEYGAEIGRSVVNFKGPIVFCVVSRYHGGAYVVFSRTLNENLQAAALEGSYASVIGGAPAAAVVFARDVDTRTRKDSRLEELNQQVARAEGAEKGRLRVMWNDLFKRVYSEKMGEVAAEFDRVHSVERALRVGALDHILPSWELRPWLIRAVERGIEKAKQLAGVPQHAARFAAANGDASLILDAHRRGEIPYWLKGSTTSRKSGKGSVTELAADQVVEASAPSSRTAKKLA